MTDTEARRVAAGVGGLQQDEWEHVMRVIMRWPRLGVCSATESQEIICGIRERLQRFKEQDNGQ